MISLTRQSRPSWIIALGSLLPLPMFGCEEPPPPPPKVVKKVQIDPGPPPATPIEDLIAQFNIDERVWMDERQAPPTDQERIGLLKFFD
ncbi:MAG: hypothetical protein QGG74_04485, partial [Phycisphaerales bacterium]|nr:hypothetical protein [Phycisphaerales bacterium]